MLGAVAQRINVRPPYGATIALDPEMVRAVDGQVAQLFASMPREFESATLDALSRARLHVLTLADSLDLDTLRLLGMLGPSRPPPARWRTSILLAAMSSPPRTTS